MESYCIPNSFPARTSSPSAFPFCFLRLVRFCVSRNLSNIKWSLAHTTTHTDSFSLLRLFLSRSQLFSFLFWAFFSSQTPTPIKAIVQEVAVVCTLLQNSRNFRILIPFVAYLYSILLDALPLSLRDLNLCAIFSRTSFTSLYQIKIDFFCSYCCCCCPSLQIRFDVLKCFFLFGSIYLLAVELLRLEYRTHCVVISSVCGSNFGSMLVYYGI